MRQFVQMTQTQEQAERQIEQITGLSVDAQRLLLKEGLWEQYTVHVGTSTLKGSLMGATTEDEERRKFRRNLILGGMVVAGVIAAAYLMSRNSGIPMIPQLTPAAQKHQEEAEQHKEDAEKHAEQAKQDAAEAAGLLNALKSQFDKLPDSAKAAIKESGELGKDAARGAVLEGIKSNSIEANPEQPRPNETPPEQPAETQPKNSQESANADEIAAAESRQNVGKVSAEPPGLRITQEELKSILSAEAYVTTGFRESQSPWLSLTQAQRNAIRHKVPTAATAPVSQGPAPALGNGGGSPAGPTNVGTRGESPLDALNAEAERQAQVQQQILQQAIFDESDQAIPARPAASPVSPAFSLLLWGGLSLVLGGLMKVCSEYYRGERWN